MGEGEGGCESSMAYLDGGGWRHPELVLPNEGSKRWDSQQHAMAAACQWQQHAMAARRMPRSRSSTEFKVLSSTEFKVLSSTAGSVYRHPHPLAHAERSLVGEAVRSDLAGVEEGLECGGGLLNFDGLALAREVVLRRAKRGHVAIWPVNLVQIDVTRLQPAQ